MNKTYKLFGGAMMLLGLTLGSCTPDSFEGGDINGLLNAADYEQYVHVNVNQETNYAVFSFDELPGVTPVWNINGRYSSSLVDSSYYRKAGDYSITMRVRNRNGMSDGEITLPFHIDNTKISGFGGFVEDSEFNLWRTATVQDPTFYYAPGWVLTSDPVYNKNGFDYSVILPTATNERWQAQMFVNTDIALSSAKTYDFSVILTSSADLPKALVKVCADNDDNNVLFSQEMDLQGGEPKCLWVSNLPGVDIETVKIVFDFGGNANNTTVNLESIVLKDHANDDGTVVPEVDTDDTVYDYDAETNLWKPVDENNAFTTEFYYAPGWSAIAAPAFTADNGTYQVVLTEATSEQWQAQVKLHTDLSAEANVKYDFSCTLHASAATKGVTVKLTDSSDDNNFFFAERVDLDADADYVFKAPANVLAEGVNADKLTLVIDFGGNPANLTATVSKIVLQKTIE